MTRSPDLPTRPLGRTGYDVSVLGFGAMELRGTSHRNPRPLPDGQAARLLGAVLDAGINLIDTSIDYGESEEIIGRSVAHRRDEYFLATKAGCPLEPCPTRRRPLPHVFTRDHIVAGLDQSLRRLRTDHVDLLQLHISPSLEVIRRDDVIATLQDLQRQGKTRFIGSSSTLPNIEDHLDLSVFDAFQVPYSALAPAHGDVIARSHEAGVGIVVRGGVAQGEPGEGRGTAAVWQAWEAAGLDEFLDGGTRTELVLRGTISHPGVSTTIVGTADVGHLEANVAAARLGPLPADVYRAITVRLTAALTVPGA